MKRLMIAIAALSIAALPASAIAKKPKKHNSGCDVCGVSAGGGKGVGTGTGGKATAYGGNGYSQAGAKASIGDITVKGGDQKQSTVIFFY